MYNRLKLLYKLKKLDKAGLESAVEKGWITEEQKNAILGI